MSKQHSRKNWPQKLLVEGNDDLKVIGTIREVCGIEDTFEIKDCESVSNIKPTLLSLLKTNVDIIGIVIDADADTYDIRDSLRARWESLKNCLIDEGYQMPDFPDINGTIVEGSNRKPRIGIWLMPDNVQHPGMLEHFVATLIPEEDPLRPIAEQVLAQIDGMRQSFVEEANWFKPIHHSKALIHTWLAWQNTPGKPMGLAIKAKLLDHNSDLCQRFVAWLNALFNSQ